MGIVEDARQAAESVAAALRGSGYRADFTPGSLWEIDRFFDVEAPDGRARPKGLLAQQLGARLFALGGYTGEVIRRHAAGTWHGGDDDPAAELNIALDLADGRRIWPVQRVMKRFSNGAEDGIVAYGVALGLDVGAQPTRPRRRWFR